MIELKQTHLVAASPDAVAATLVDTETLRAAIPNCTELRRISDGVYWGMINVGLLKYRFDLDATITVKSVKDGLRVSGTVRAGNITAGDIDSQLTLAPDGQGTRAVSVTNLRPARDYGKVAKVAGKALGAKLIKMFFDRLNALLKKRAKVA